MFVKERFTITLTAVVNHSTKHVFLETRTFSPIESENEKTGQDLEMTR